MDAQQIQQLCQPYCFSHPVTALQLIETHISWVILTGQFAYKIKKPVNFGFLDFSTLDKRHHCCKEELRLNQRSSDDLYLDVVAIRESTGRMSVGGVGETVEYAVKMRQFDPQALLSELLAKDQVPLESFFALGYRIGAFHGIAAVAETSSAWGDYDAVTGPVIENFVQIHERIKGEDSDLLITLQARVDEDLIRLKPLLQTRKQHGFIRELHGDLHAGNIALIDQQWVAFDCIEFNPNLRWIDTASDVAFLVMDLEYRGYAAEANRFLNGYLEYTGDYGLLDLLPFYKSYRAMVRAKVAILRWQQTADEKARSGLIEDFRGYLQYCVTLQERPAPFLAMMMGVSGSGKSTVAKQVASEYGAIHIRSDAVRKRLYGMAPDAVSPESLRDELYSEQTSEKTFASMVALADSLLQQGYAVIVDATFIRRHTRQPFVALAKAQHVPLIILHCKASEAELAQRIRRRELRGGDASEAGVEVMRQQLQGVEVLSEDESDCELVVEGEWEAVLRERVTRT